ncbi:MAG TPA: acyl carrier protein [Vicinamibacterales bacterium]|jgi:acyl carrier protein|nr:acyl carrier protein [Vicinamibacterales bacterium]
MPTNIETEVRRFVVDNFLFGQEDRLDDDASFLETGVIDSTGVLELVGFLESTYGITLADSELVPENLDSVARVVRFVRRKLAEGDRRLAG